MEALSLNTLLYGDQISSINIKALFVALVHVLEKIVRWRSLPVRRREPFIIIFRTHLWTGFEGCVDTDCIIFAPLKIDCMVSEALRIVTKISKSYGIIFHVNN